ncbi:MAG: N-6 DNA methylase [Anaerolineales bacterium]|nr:N-6 DNA methylase [Anaerolineales bacterium]
MRYSAVDEKKENGVHYTPKTLSDFVADKIYKVIPTNFQERCIHVMDPAVGNGELLCSLLNVLSSNQINNKKITGFDTDKSAILFAHQRISSEFPRIPLALRNEDFLEFAFKNKKQLGLFDDNNFERFDIVIANPPYVRTQIMGGKKSRELSKQFNLTGRVDLYHAFIQGISHVLQPNGIAGIIISNKLLSTKSGASIRENILDDFDVLDIWDLGDTRLFEAAVLPAVLLLRKKGENSLIQKASFTSIYTTQGNPTKFVDNAISALDMEGIISTHDGNIYLVRQGELEYGQKTKNVWRIANKKSEDWLSTVKANTAYSFDEVGDIKVGVKTTADKVFIRTDWNELPENERPELLRPLVTHHIARRYRATDSSEQREILYPHMIIQGKRGVANLDNYPKTSQYLEKFRNTLEARSYLIDSGRLWYEIWVPQDPSAWDIPKIVMRDISEKPTFWMDLSKSVINGDCYWITCKNPQQIELLWLMLAVANSTLAEAFYDHRFHNKLYAGRRRYNAQYVKEFPLPDPNTPLAKQIIQATKQIYDLVQTDKVDELDEALDQLVWQAFGFNQKSL